ncbi:acyl-CoA dehydrogenase [Streptomyces sp. RB6PN25]|uniref:Acyl-CoA dehydrogenase n=1 Tax=Streptomyces humicola TaxID=2953240 RepID=A0ABT1Q2Y6_9ACTN|nr:acyl-CoA dehydrogenase [Streptomyces humicola]MCQ4084291.1 acyl-CoA dehydrogenase [Streptomyces humicola]
MVTALPPRTAAAPTTVPVTGLRHRSWALAARFDRELGDPCDEATVFSYEHAIRLDRTETFPDEICAALNTWGLAHYYVPAAYGGALDDFQDLQMLIRTAARRDLTTTIAHGKTFLGSLPVWVGADAATAARLGGLVRAGARVSLGLTERTHGSDIMAGELTAEPQGRGYRLNGEKWLINNATRGRLITLLARTSPAGGPRGFSALLVDKDDLPAQAWQCLPKVHTHGVRGADISGITLHDALVGPQTLIGTEGSGAELMMKSLQVSRALCPSLSLGAADQALRLAVRFSRGRELYGRHLADLPLTRRTLAEGFADLLLCEAVSTVAVRSIHALPSELSVTAAAVKYLVPSLVDGVIDRLGSLLGARSVLGQQYAHGMYQKIARDHRIVGIFDGNSLVNQYALVSQFRSLARAYLGPDDHRPGLAMLFDLERTLPRFAAEGLALVSRYGSSILGTLPGSVARLSAMADRAPALAGAARRAQQLGDAASELHRRMRRVAPTVADASAECFTEARRYALCLAGAACLGLWLHSNEAAEAECSSGELWRDGLWLHASLRRILARLGMQDGQDGQDAAADDGVFDELYERLVAHYQQGFLFSLLPCPIAEGPPSC